MPLPVVSQQVIVTCKRRVRPYRLDGAIGPQVEDSDTSGRAVELHFDRDGLTVSHLSDAVITMRTWFARANHALANRVGTKTDRDKPHLDGIGGMNLLEQPPVDLALQRAAKYRIDISLQIYNGGDRSIRPLDPDRAVRLDELNVGRLVPGWRQDEWKCGQPRLQIPMRAECLHVDMQFLLGVGVAQLARAARHQGIRRYGSALNAHLRICRVN